MDGQMKSSNFRGKFMTERGESKQQARQRKASKISQSITTKLEKQQ